MEPLLTWGTGKDVKNPTCQYCGEDAVRFTNVTGDTFYHDRTRRNREFAGSESILLRVCEACQEIQRGEG